MARGGTWGPGSFGWEVGLEVASRPGVPRGPLWLDGGRSHCPSTVLGQRPLSPCSRGLESWRNFSTTAPVAPSHLRQPDRCSPSLPINLAFLLGCVCRSRTQEAWAPTSPFWRTIPQRTTTTCPCHLLPNAFSPWLYALYTTPYCMPQHPSSLSSFPSNIQCSDICLSLNSKTKYISTLFFHFFPSFPSHILYPDATSFSSTCTILIVQP